MLDLVWLIPALPLAGFLLLVVFGRKLGEPAAGWLASAMVGLSFVVTLIVFAGLIDKPDEERQFTQILWQWLPVGNLRVDVAFLVDPLSITMAIFVTGIATLIHVYSIGYMHKDERFSKFFIYMNLFVFSMLLLILGNNLVLTFVGWEGVGTCSYLLISFWFTEKANAVAGKKAFVTNRIGDFGFMLGMFLTFSVIGSLNYLDITAKATTLATVTATAIALLFFLGAARQVRPAAAVGVAPRRDGRPDARVRADPRGHDGHRRCVPALPARARARPDGDRPERHRRSSG